MKGRECWALRQQQQQPEGIAGDPPGDHGLDTSSLSSLGTNRRRCVPLQTYERKKERKQREWKGGEAFLPSSQVLPPIVILSWMLLAPPPPPTLSPNSTASALPLSWWLRGTTQLHCRRRWDFQRLAPQPHR